MKSWWHAFTDGDMVYMGQSAESPEVLLERMPSDGVIRAGMRYVRSWDHEPSLLERRVADLDI